MVFEIFRKIWGKIHKKVIAFREESQGGGPFAGEGWETQFSQ